MSRDAEVMSVNAETDAFSLTRIEADQARCTVLFAAGRGGNPGRHRPLMDRMAERGCTVIAPHFEMLAPSFPSKADLDKRILRLAASIRDCARRDLPVFGVGHSIGATALLALQGAEGEVIDGQRLMVGTEAPLGRLALLAPPTDFFRRPGALRRITTPISIWVGEKDSVTPPAQSRFLLQALGDQASVELHIDPDAGHFTYMDELPPNAPEPHPDREAFLARLAEDVAAFLNT